MHRAVADRPAHAPVPAQLPGEDRHARATHHGQGLQQKVVPDGPRPRAQPRSIRGHPVRRANRVVAHQGRRGSDAADRLPLRPVLVGRAGSRDSTNRPGHERVRGCERHVVLRDALRVWRVSRALGGDAQGADGGEREGDQRGRAGEQCQRHHVGVSAHIPVRGRAGVVRLWAARHRPASGAVREGDFARQGGRVGAEGGPTGHRHAGVQQDVRHRRGERAWREDGGSDDLGDVAAGEEDGREAQEARQEHVLQVRSGAEAARGADDGAGEHGSQEAGWVHGG